MGWYKPSLQGAHTLASMASLVARLNKPNSMQALRSFRGLHFIALWPGLAGAAAQRQSLSIHFCTVC